MQIILITFTSFEDYNLYLSVDLISGDEFLCIAISLSKWAKQASTVLNVLKEFVLFVCGD